MVIVEKFINERTNPAEAMVFPFVVQDEHEDLLLDELSNLIRQAGAIALEHQGKGEVRMKAPGARPEHSAVTQGDFAVEDFLVDFVKGRYANVTVYSEEAGFWNPHQEYRLVLDPIDGTRIYAEGSNFFSTTMALQTRDFTHDGPDEYRTSMGFTYLPARRELFTAREGKGAWRNGKRISVGNIDNIGDAIVADEMGWDSEKRSEAFEAYQRVCVNKRIQRYSSAAVLAYIAAGNDAQEQIDSLTFLSLSPHDFEAGKLLLQEANGRFDMFRRSGDSANYLGCRFDIVASNGTRLHDQLLAITEKL